jgi:hypothetical protein
MIRALKIIWLLIAVTVLVGCLLAYDGSPNSDADVLLGYGLLALSFPIGLLIAIVLGGAGQAVSSSYGFTFSVSYASLSITWLIFCAISYLQWFIFIPWILRRARSAGSKEPVLGDK